MSRSLSISCQSLRIFQCFSANSLLMLECAMTLCVIPYLYEYDCTENVVSHIVGMSEKQSLRLESFYENNLYHFIQRSENMFVFTDCSISILNSFVVNTVVAALGVNNAKCCTVIANSADYYDICK